MHALLAKHQVISETDSSLVSPRQSFVSNDRHQQITVHRLAEKFGSGPQRAHATLRATTQRGVRSNTLPCLPTIHS